MTTSSTTGVGQKESLEYKGSIRRLPLARLAALGLALLTVVVGCQTPPTKAPAGKTSDSSEAIILREGDSVKVSFPGSPNLDTTQQIRRDGKIVLSLVGEVTAAGMTPADLEKSLKSLYAPQLVSKEVTVTVVSSTFPVFVTGAVVRPGKVMSDHPITALEAVMESGGFDYAKANLSAVTVIRNEGGHLKNYTLNLKLVMMGRQSTPFYLKPADIVYVSEKFSWF
jgi:polysaccharide export outer membrane protein